MAPRPRRRCARLRDARPRRVSPPTACAPRRRQSAARRKRRSSSSRSPSPSARGRAGHRPPCPVRRRWGGWGFRGWRTDSRRPAFQPCCRFRPSRSCRRFPRPQSSMFPWRADSRPARGFPQADRFCPA